MTPTNGHDAPRAFFVTNPLTVRPPEPPPNDTVNSLTGVAFTRRCNWLQRLWHRRLRNIDRATMVPVIRRTAPQSKFIETFENGWTLFIEMPGQSHWRCACGIDKTPDGRD